MNSRLFALILACAVLTTAVLVTPLWMTAQTQPHIRASQVLTDAYADVLCRTPNETEIVRWHSMPLDGSQLRETLGASTEADKLRAVRRRYADVVRRNIDQRDCGAVRASVDRDATAAEVDRRIAGLPEARRVGQIRRLFAEVFGRDPVGWDDASLRRWVDSPFTLTEIRERLLLQRPVVAVYYFTWYRSEPGRWGNNLTEVPSDTPRPLAGTYGSDDLAVIDRQIQQMSSIGLDFVIVQVTAQSQISWDNAHAFFRRLNGRPLKAAVMLDGLYNETAAAKAMWVAKAASEFTRSPNYFFWQGQPLIMLFSARLDFMAPGVLLRNVYWTDRYDSGYNRFNVDQRLQPHDWPFWSPSPQPLVNGLVPVVPGYVDRDLGRSRTMEYPRNNGQMYREQWRRALALRPEIIAVYSWNEYFERTAIEPTQAWGDQYLEMTACFILLAHRGETGSC